MHIYLTSLSEKPDTQREFKYLSIFNYLHFSVLLSCTLNNTSLKHSIYKAFKIKVKHIQISYIIVILIIINT